MSLILETNLGQISESFIFIFSHATINSAISAIFTGGAECFGVDVEKLSGRL
jgi:hypothetical protein